ncbi:uncharacterized protein LOC62_01G000511 [Vanrija pseudolonga]|uniref:Uncharacterized protein n=1 Tax=Vanrija pseudolonga TaxID=143232 RepID=A0AAF0Y559_9TREE|nr:hypothetical protein LOC62_01G000511 [Vanrija pseudolonga]
MFFSDGASDHPGLTPWKEFEFAMKEVGLEVTKINGGTRHFSAVSPAIVPRAPYSTHAPHDGKIEFWTVRAMGRDLANKYGWTWETFSLKQ